MQHSVTFSGSAKLIGTLALIAHHLENDDREKLLECLDIWDDIKPEESYPTVGVGTLQVNLGQGPEPDHKFETGPDGLIVVPPQKQREKADYKAHRIAAEKARAEQIAQQQTQGQHALNIQGGAPGVAQQLVQAVQTPTEPNAAANQAIQQQHQWAQQPVQQAPSFPAQTGFPATAPAQAATGFPASNPAAPAVGTNGQPWLNPATINQQGPTFEQLNQLIAPLVQNPQQRQALGNWLQYKQIPNFEAIADQPALLAEAYSVATQILNGQIQ